MAHAAEDEQDRTVGDEPVWHALDADDAARELDVDPERGLDAEAVDERLGRYGENVIEQAEQTPAWKLAAQQFADPLVVILTIAAVVAGAVGDIKDPIVIAVVLLLNAVIGFYQEREAQSSMAALAEMLTFTARVRRGGEEQEVDGSKLVPGDIVLLTSGSRVPADGRLVRAQGLQVEEAALTGESAAVEKDTDPADADAPLAERTGMLFMNTTVSRGEAELVVVATGMQTEVGQIAQDLRDSESEQTPLQQQLSRLTKQLALVAGAACAALLAIGLGRGEPFSDVLLDAVALAVAAVPEGLAAVVTVTLAVGMNQMAKRNAIVKRLASVETLGSTTVICTDKTGTLTLNEMTARRIVTAAGSYDVGGEGYATKGEISGDDVPDLTPVLLPGVLCSDAELDGDDLDGEPTEGALLVAGVKAGIDPDDAREQHPRINEIAFDSQRKYMATFHDLGDGPTVLVKGAPQVLMEHCSSRWTPDGDEELDDDARSEVETAVDDLSNDGMRVLALASRRLDSSPSEDADEDELEEHVADLTLLAVVGIVDPTRTEVVDAIRTCRDAGITVKMITGDHKVTASAIAREIGIDDHALEGRELGELPEDERAQAAHDTGVFARVSPRDKVQIVESLRERGEIVAMTGDGVNDAGAMHAAHIGVAMGKGGTDVAKEAGEVVLTDDDFSTIVEAVRRGRSIYDNIVAFVRFQLSTNFGAIIAILGARLFGLPTPFTPVQILWVNIIMDGPPALALGVDPPDPKVMDREPRSPGDPVLGRARLARLLLTGVVMAAGTLGVYVWGRDAHDETTAMTLAFTTFVLFQVVNSFNARSEFATAFRRYSLRNARLLLALAGVLVLQVLAVQLSPLQAIFDTTGLTVTQWALCAAIALSVLLVEELRKLAERTIR